MLKLTRCSSHAVAQAALEVKPRAMGWYSLDSWFLAEWDEDLEPLMRDEEAAPVALFTICFNANLGQLEDGESYTVPGNSDDVIRQIIAMSEQPFSYTSKRDLRRGLQRAKGFA